MHITTTAVGAKRLKAAHSAGFQNRKTPILRQKSGVIEYYRSSSDGLWWAADNARHGGSAFKVFRETGKGLEWFRDADQFDDFFVGKHTGATGQFIPWKELKGR